MKRIAGALVVSSALSLISGSIPAAPTTEFTRAPSVLLTDLKGAKSIIEYKDHKLTLVNFWAVWCLPCREEMPQIAKLVEKYGKDGFQAVGVAVESGKADDVQTFLDKHKDLGIKYRVLLGDDAAMERFGDVSIVPTTYLFDTSGKLVESYLGVRQDFYKEVSQVVHAHLGLPPAEATPGAKPGAKAPAKAPAAKP
jgi:thiol-disulfide isomerase/thioredoxin